MKIYDKNGYVNIPGILAEGYPFIFIVGGRGTGKTYGALKTVIEQHITFMLMRRTKTQIEIVNKNEFSPFKPLCADFGWNLCTRPISKDSSGIYMALHDEDTGKDIAQGSPLGYTCALSTISNMRGFDASDV